MRKTVKIFCAILALVSGLSFTNFTVARADEKFVKNVSVTLSDGIAVRYTVNVPAEVENAKMEFSYRGNTYYSEKENPPEGENEFVFNELSPQYMSEEINYVLYFDGVEKERSESAFTFENYAKTLLSKTASELNQTAEENENMQKLVVDALFYGKAAAEYKGVTANPTSGLTEEQKNKATSFTALTSSDKNVEGEGENLFKTAGIRFCDKVGLFFTFAGDFSENDVVTLEAEKNGKKTVISEFEEENGVYTAIYEDITLLEFDVPVKVTLYLNGEKIDKTITYSVKSNVYAFQNSEDKPFFKELARCVYNYGLSAKAYKAACSAPFSYTVETKNCINWWESKAFNPSQDNFVNCIIDKSNGDKGWSVNSATSGDQYVGSIAEKNYISFCVYSEIEGDAIMKLVASSAELEKHNNWVPIETKVINLANGYTLSYGTHIDAQYHTATTISETASVGGDKTDNEEGDNALWTAWHETELAKIHLKQGANYIRLTRNSGGGTGINVKSASFEFIR